MPCENRKNSFAVDKIKGEISSHRTMYTPPNTHSSHHRGGVVGVERKNGLLPSPVHDLKTGG